MSKGVIQVVFVDNSGTSFISDAIHAVEKLGDKGHSSFVPTHCGIIVDNVFREALANGFVETDVHRYPKERLRVFDVDIDNMEAVRAKFTELSGRKYGYRALVNGELYTLFGVKTKGDGEATGDCSEDDTRILRTDKPEFLGDVPADDVTPLVLYEGIEDIGRLRDYVD
jgi:hypothetical protein